MRSKILFIVLLMSLFVVLKAQTTETSPNKPLHRPGNETRIMSDGKEGPVKGLNLSDAQKATFKESMMAMQKQLQPVKNELGEAEAHQKTLMTADQPDLIAINKNIDKIGAMRIEMAKIKTKYHLEMRSQLNDEQRLKFDLFSEKMMDMKGENGRQPNRGMHQQHPQL
ncbi:MAG: periplasmic heavy metal sensor [Mariniphaga sp.]